MKLKILRLMVVGLLAGAMVANAGVIDTTGASFMGLHSFGEPGTATYGQMFTVAGPDTQLDSFSFRFDDRLSPTAPGTVDFAAYVFAWDGVKVVGPQLYASAQVSSTNNGGTGGFELFTFNTGGLNLTAAQQYVAFVSTLFFFDGVISASFWQFSIGDAYSGGRFVLNPNNSDFGQLTSTAWTDVGVGDLWFRANFSAPVPEPGTLALIGLGLAGIGYQRRKRAA